MVKSQSDWNSYVKDFEPFELEEYYCHISLMEVFALKFDFGPRMQAEISGNITIIDHPVRHTLFSTSSDDFLLMNSGKFTEVSGGTKQPISVFGPVEIRLDLVDKSYGNLDFERNFGFKVEEDKEIGKEEGEEEEEEQTKEEKEEKEELMRLCRELYEKETSIADEKGLCQRKKRTATERAEARKIFNLWESAGFRNRYTDKLLRKKLTTPCCSLEVMFAVYKDAMAASVEVTFADWNPSHFTGNSRGKRRGRCANTFCQPDPYIAMSDGMRVFGQVTVRNTLLTHPDATTTLFGKAIDEDVIIRLGDIIPFSKTFVVFPRKSSLLLDIDLRHALRNVPLSGHKVPPSELFVKTTLEITNRHCSYCRFIVKDSGPAKLFVDVTWYEFSPEMFLT